MFTGPMAAADDKDSSWLVFKSEFFQLHYRFQFESDANKFKGFFESGIEALEGGEFADFPVKNLLCVHCHVYSHPHRTDKTSEYQVSIKTKRTAKATVRL